MGVLQTIGSMLGLTGETSLFLTLIFFTAIIVIYSIFVFYFYRFLAKKNIIELNLNQYNKYDEPSLIKFFAILFYIVEYIILLPVITFFWFAILAILILVLGKGLEISTILLITAALVASVRATSYVSENLSRDLAKMIPFTMLTIAFTTAGFFDTEALIMRITEIPALLGQITYYLLFIIGVELIMRAIDFVEQIFKGPDIMEEED